MRAGGLEPAATGSRPSLMHGTLPLTKRVAAGRRLAPVSRRNHDRKMLDRAASPGRRGRSFIRPVA